MKQKLIKCAPELLEDNIEWCNIHDALLKEGVIISKTLSDRIFIQCIKSKETIKKATE